MESIKKRSYVIILIFGIISLLGDVIYEGARSIYGPFTKTIEMDIVLVGIIIGTAEFLGYFIRIISGILADKTKWHWLFILLGYGLLISVPLMALTGIWQIITIFIILERIGKAIRSPAKDAILSVAAKNVGTGWGFALHEVMDQIGGIIGPLFFTIVFILTKSKITELKDYQLGFNLMWIPYLLLMTFLIILFILYPDPEKLQSNLQKEEKEERLSKTFWLYTIFTFLTTFGFVNFVILGYYFKQNSLITDAQIPLFYAIAMFIDGIAALIVGRLYDKIKEKRGNKKSSLTLLIIIPLFTLLIPLFSFAKNYILLIIGIVIWGIVMGTHETIMKAGIADLTNFKKRSSGYGIFNTSYGLSILAGSSVISFLYKFSIKYVIIFVIFIQVVSLIFYFFLLKNIKK